MGVCVGWGRVKIQSWEQQSALKEKSVIENLFREVSIYDKAKSLCYCLTELDFKAQVT